MTNMIDKPFVTLRAIEPEDLDLLYKIENDTFLWNVGTTNVPYSRYLLHNYVASSTGDIYKDRQMRLIIQNKNNESIGIIDLVEFDPRNRRAEVGIVIMDKYRRKGYANAALMKIEKDSIEVIHLHQLYVYIDVKNIASIRLFEKAGYESEKELKEWLYDGKDYNDALLMQRFLEKK